MSDVAKIFASEEVISKGLLADYMFQSTPYRKEAMEEIKRQSFNWKATANESYIRDAGWYFKTLAVQEVGNKITHHPSYYANNALSVVSKLDFVQKPIGSISRGILKVAPMTK